MTDDLLAAAQVFCTPFYTQPERAYHNLDHVQAMLHALKTRRVLTPALALAVWGHDLIYDPREHDNEERSADAFGAWLESQGADMGTVGKVRRLILATRHNEPPTDQSAALLTDADLSILGAAAPAFWAYERAIRQEYGFVAWEAYQAGRSAVLQGFLERERIYSTPEFAGLEAGARANMAAALDMLAGREERQAQQRWRRWS